MLARLLVLVAVVPTLEGALPLVAQVPSGR